jgi:hypothetical protein
MGGLKFVRGYELKFMWRHSTPIILSLIARRQSIAASVQNPHDSVGKSVLFTIDSRCVRRNDQLIDRFEVVSR